MYFLRSILFVWFAAAFPATLQAQSFAAGDNEIRVLLVGNIETTLSSEINASIRRLPVDLGERFKKGRLLVEFDCRLPRAQLDKAEAELQAARKTYEANLKLQEYEAISQLEVAVAEAAVLKAKADVAFSKAQVSLCTVRAPFTGRVVNVHASLYSSVGSGTPLLDIIDESELTMQLHLPSMWLKDLRQGKQFQVRIDETGREYKAEIQRISAKVDPISQTIQVSARIIDKDKDLLAGMSGTAHFQFDAAE